MRRSMSLALVSALALGVVAGPAAANPLRSKRSLVFLGMVSAVSVDADPATQDTLTFSLLKGNRHAGRYQEAHPGDVTVAMNDETFHKGPTDYRVGDGVKVRARMAPDGSGLVARSVRLVLHSYHGTLEAYDPVLGTATVLVDHAGRVAAAYLAAHGNPSSLAFVFAPGSGDPMLVAGDVVVVKARPTADGLGLEALKISSEDEPG